MTTHQEVENILAIQRKRRDDLSYELSKRPATITIKQMAVFAGCSEIWIRKLLTRSGAPGPVELGEQYRGGRTPDLYDKVVCETWLTDRFNMIRDTKRASDKYDKSGRMLFNAELHGNKNRPWSTPDRTHVISRYGIDSVAEISLALERTEASIIAFAGTLRKQGLLK